MRKKLLGNERITRMAEYRVNEWDYEAYTALYTELVKQGFPEAAIHGAVNSAINELEDNGVVESKPYNPEQWTKDDLQKAFEEAMVTGDMTPVEEISQVIQEQSDTYWQIIPQAPEDYIKAAAKKAFLAVSGDANDAQAVRVLSIAGYDKKDAENWKNNEIRQDLYAYMDSGDWRSVNEEIVLLKKNGVSDESIKSSLTSKYKPLIIDAYQNGNTEEYNKLVDTLKKINVYDAKGRLYYTQERILSWLED